MIGQITVVVSDTEIINSVVYDTENIATVVGLQGPAGAKGDTAIGNDYEITAGEDLSGHRVVRMYQGKGYYASNTDVSHAHAILGITKQAIMQNEVGKVQTYGEMTENSWNWTPYQPVFLGNDGHLTQSTGGQYVLQIATAIDSKTIFIDIKQPIIIGG